jgi:hypothetical protein
MNARLLFECVALLENAGNVLVGGEATVREQVDLGMDCNRKAIDLKLALEELTINVNGEEHVAA